MTIEADVALLLSYFLSSFGIGMAFGILVRLWRIASGQVR
jgi:hypothetical protein